MFQNRISEFVAPEGDRLAEGWAANPWANGGKPPGTATAALYSAAWTLAHRDHELDKLFNASFYYEI